MRRYQSFKKIGLSNGAATLPISLARRSWCCGNERRPISFLRFSREQGARPYGRLLIACFLVFLLCSFRAKAMDRGALFRRRPAMDAGRASAAPGTRATRTLCNVRFLNGGDHRRALARPLGTKLGAADPGRSLLCHALATSSALASAAAFGIFCSGPRRGSVRFKSACPDPAFWYQRAFEPLATGKRLRLHQN